MRLALVVDHFDPRHGGREQWTVGFARYLLERGHSVDVVAQSQSNHELPALFHQLPNSHSPLTNARHAASVIASLNVDAVYDSGTGWSCDVFHPHSGSDLASLEANIAALRGLARLRSELSPRLRLRRFRTVLLERRQIAAAPRIVALSRRIRSHLGARYHLSRDRFEIIPNGVDTKRFHPNRMAGLRNGARQKLGIANETTLLACISNNLLLKGLDTTLRALGRLNAQGRQVELAVAGALPTSDIATLVHRIGIGHRVRFLGRIDPIDSVFAAADIFVHPSRWDACCLATLEALASGVAVICSPMDGASELVEHGSSGYVLRQPDDDAELAAAIDTLLAPGVLRRMGHAAHELMRQHDISHNFHCIEALLAEEAASRL